MCCRRVSRFFATCCKVSPEARAAESFLPGFRVWRPGRRFCIGKRFFTETNLPSTRARGDEGHEARFIFMKKSLIHLPLLGLALLIGISPVSQARAVVRFASPPPPPPRREEPPPPPKKHGEPPPPPRRAKRVPPSPRLAPPRPAPPPKPHPGGSGRR